MRCSTTQNVHKPLALFAAAVLAPAAMVVGGCTTNAATGDTRFNSLSRSEEIALGTEAMPQLVAEYGGEVSNAGARQYLTEVGSKLAAQTEADYPTLPWEFTLLDSDVINAFALPGGKVFMSRGLAEQLDSEAALAGVLGHEVGHVTAEHIDERMTRSMGVEVLAGVVGAVAGQSESAVVAQALPQIVGTAGQGYLLKFGRDQESEADSLGLRYMTRAGYQPSALLDVMEVLVSASQSGRQPEILSTHPYPETRIERITHALQGEYAAAAADTSLQMGESAYQSRLLRPLAWTPINPEAERRALAIMAAAGGTNGWCAHCRAQAQVEAAAQATH